VKTRSTRSIKASRHRSRGLSTAEVLAGTALSLLALSALYSVQHAQTQAFAAQRTYAESQAVTRTVVDLMTRELRMASYDPANALTTSQPPGCPGVKQGIVEASATKLRFKQDLDGDGQINTAGEDVVYDILGSEIRRTEGASLPVTLVEHVPVDGFSFRYFDTSNPPVELIPTGTPAVLTPTQRDCVAKVRITIRANIPNPDPDISSPVQSLAQTEIAIRNRSLINF
jgi:hypothetical protein